MNCPYCPAPEALGSRPGDLRWTCGTTQQPHVRRVQSPVCRARSTAIEDEVDRRLLVHHFGRDE